MNTINHKGGTFSIQGVVRTGEAITMEIVIKGAMAMAAIMGTSISTTTTIVKWQTMRTINKMEATNSNITTTIIRMGTKWINHKAII